MLDQKACREELLLALRSIHEAIEEKKEKCQDIRYLQGMASGYINMAFYLGVISDDERRKFQGW